MNQQPITVDNVNDFTRRYIEHGDQRTKAAAWTAVYNFCKQNGMDKKTIGIENPSGVQMVIKFIQDHVHI